MTVKYKTESLLNIINELAACNELTVKPVKKWPRIYPDFDIKQLNDEASRIPKEMITDFVDGEESVAANISHVCDAHHLHSFLYCIFDGPLHSKIIYHPTGVSGL